MIGRTWQQLQGVSMRTEEDEAFDDLARKQGAWGGGFKAKQAMAADKLQEPWNEDEWRRNNWRCGHGWLRGEQCEICNAPQPAQEPVVRVLQIIKELRPAIKPMEGMGKGKTTDEWFDILVKEIERIQPAQQEALYGMNQDDWKDVVAAIVKVRDGRGIYLGCRPADVFQEWFLALGTAKVKEKNNA